MKNKDIDKNDFNHYLKYHCPKDADPKDYLKDYLIDNCVCGLSVCCCCKQSS